jgi:hypothetical protein
VDDALTRLEAANPVPAGAREWIAAELGLDASDSIPREPRRRLGRLVAIAAAVLLAVLVVAPALGHGIPGLDFFHAEKAPPDVVRNFADFGVGAPAGMDPRVIPGETRKIETIRFASGKLHTLWVAPTKAGGLCFEWTNADGGCDASGTLPLSVTWMGSAGDTQSVDGFAHSRWVDEIQVKLSNGTTVEPDVTWVSAPISAGFFHYDAPAATSVRSVVGLRHGDAVTADNLGSGQAEPAVSPFADLSKKQQAAAIDTPAGEATIWTAPTKTDEVCSWLDFAGKQWRAAPCLPVADAYQGLSLGASNANGTQVVWAAGSPDYATELVFRWDDGTTDVVTAKNKFFLEAARADKTGVLVARRADGTTLPNFRVDLPMPTG